MLVGVGIGSYAFANAQYDPLTGERDTHNTSVNLSAESGLPALLLFIGLIYLTIRPCHHAIISLRVFAAEAFDGDRWHGECARGVTWLPDCSAAMRKILFLYVFMAFTFCLSKALLPPVKGRRAQPDPDGAELTAEVAL